MWTYTNHFNFLSLNLLVCKIEIHMHLFLGCCCKENLHLCGTVYNNRYIIDSCYYYITLWNKVFSLKTLISFSGLFLVNWSNYEFSQHINIKNYLCTYIHVYLFSKYLTPIEWYCNNEFLPYLYVFTVLSSALEF